jgi:hypothetical protein
MRDARRTSRTLETFAGLILVSLAALAPPALAASVTNIRIGQHPGHVRVVLDLDGPISFQPAGGTSLLLKGLSGGGAVLNADPGDAPLQRVELKPQGKNTLLSFKAKAPLSVKAFTLTPDADGGNRLVVDLYAKAPPRHAAKASTTPPATTAETAADKGRPAVPPAPVAAKAPATSAPVQATETATNPSDTPAKSAPAPAAAAATAEPTPARATMTAPAPVAKTATTMTPMENAMAAMPSLPASTPTRAPTSPPDVIPPPARAADSGAAIIAERTLDSGDAQTACAEASQVLKNNPVDVRGLVVLGGCKLKLGDALAARTAYASAIRIDGGFDRARIGMAEAEAKLGNTAAARAQYQRVLGDNLPTDDVYRVIAAMRALDAPAPANKPPAKPAQHPAEPTS